VSREKPFYSKQGRTVLFRQNSAAILDMPARTSSNILVTNPLFWCGVALILLVSLVLRLWDIGGANLWADEALTAQRAQSSLQDSLNSLLEVWNQTPLYFLVLRILPTHNETLLRLPSVLVGVAGVGMFMLVATRIYGNHEFTLWAGALLAVNPYHILLSRTARPYALVFVLSLIIIYHSILLMRGDRSFNVWVVFMVGSMIAYLTHYSTVSVLVVQFLLTVFILRKPGGFLKRWGLAQAIAIVPVAIWALMATLKLNVTEVWSSRGWTPQPTLRDIPLTIRNMTVGHNGTLDGVIEWYVWPGVLLALLCLSLGTVRAIRYRKRFWEDIYWVLLIFVPIATVYAISKLIAACYVDRYFMVLLPAVLFLLVQGSRWLPRHVGRIALLLILLTSAYNILYIFNNNNHHRANWQDVSSYIAHEAQSDDIIIVDRKSTYIAFRQYFPNYNDIEIVLLAEMPDTEFVEAPYKRIWVIYRNPIENVHWLGVMPDFDPFEAGLSQIGNWLISQKSRVIEQQEFNGAKIFLLEGIAQ
jgi:hypothetical protein